MADVSKILGYNIKDKTARDSIAALNNYPIKKATITGTVSSSGNINIGKSNDNIVILGTCYRSYHTVALSINVRVDSGGNIWFNLRDADTMQAYQPSGSISIEYYYLER